MSYSLLGKFWMLKILGLKKGNVVFELWISSLLLYVLRFDLGQDCSTLLLDANTEFADFPVAFSSPTNCQV